MRVGSASLPAWSPRWSCLPLPWAIHSVSVPTFLRAVLTPPPAQLPLVFGCTLPARSHPPQGLCTGGSRPSRTPTQVSPSLRRPLNPPLHVYRARLSHLLRSGRAPWGQGSWPCPRPPAGHLAHGRRCQRFARPCTQVPLAQGPEGTMPPAQPAHRGGRPGARRGRCPRGRRTAGRPAGECCGPRRGWSAGSRPGTAQAGT